MGMSHDVVVWQAHYNPQEDYLRERRARMRNGAKNALDRCWDGIRALEDACREVDRRNAAPWVCADIWQGPRCRMCGRPLRDENKRHPYSHEEGFCVPCDQGCEASLEDEDLLR